MLWPDEPQAKARRNLCLALSFLRQALDDRGHDLPFLLISRETLQFNAESDHWLDSAAFAALVRANREHQHRHLETCLPCMHRLDQFYLNDSSSFEEWALLQREWFHREAVDALAHLAN